MRYGSGMRIRTAAGLKKITSPDGINLIVPLADLVGLGGGNVFTYRVGATPSGNVFATAIDAYQAAKESNTFALLAVDDAAAPGTAELLPLDGGDSFDFTQMRWLACNSTDPIANQGMPLHVRDGAKVTNWGVLDGVVAILQSSSPVTRVLASETKLISCCNYGGMYCLSDGPIVVNDGGYLEFDSVGFSLIAGLPGDSAPLVRLSGAGAQVAVVCTGLGTIYAAAFAGTNPHADGNVYVALDAGTRIVGDVTPGTYAASVSVIRPATMSSGPTAARPQPTAGTAYLDTDLDLPILGIGFSWIDFQGNPV